MTACIEPELQVAVPVSCLHHILVLIAVGVAALLVTVAVLDKEVPLQLVVAAAVSGLLGARLLMLSRPPRGHLRVFTHDGAYRSETSSEGSPARRCTGSER